MKRCKFIVFFPSSQRFTKQSFKYEPLTTKYNFEDQSRAFEKAVVCRKVDLQANSGFGGQKTLNDF